MSIDELEFLQSLTDLELQALLTELPPEDQTAILEAMLQPTSPKGDARTADAERKRKVRSAASEIKIPACKDEVRRMACIKEPVRFLKTYFPERYFMPFSDNHFEMINAIADRATNGGAQAIAAPRGEGKTELTTGMLVWSMLAGLVQFPVIIAATGGHAARIFSDIKLHFESNDLLLEDYPEICVPVRELDGAPQRAARQRIEGVKTNIVWAGSEVVLPTVEGSKFSGVCMTYSGLDSAIRGLKIRGRRPDFVLIDDPETSESANSEVQIATRESILERDLAGLVGQGKTLSKVMLCTRQNRRCISFKYTDPKLKPSWNGKCYKFVEKWPDTESLWEDYIDMRREDQRNGDEYGERASQFYLTNKAEMDKGAKVSNPWRYDPNLLPSGSQNEYSTLQSAYNKISDTSYDAFLTEYQNDPAVLEGESEAHLKAATVAGRQSGLERGKYHQDTVCTTIGIDLGKYACHWAEVAWLPDAVGHVVDYGVLEVQGVTMKSTTVAAEVSLMNALMQFRMEIMDQERPPNAVVVDTGTFTSTAYQFLRNTGGKPFFASKGRNPWNAGTGSDTRLVGHHWFASKLAEEQLWLYNLDTDYWKSFLHQRFRTPTFNEANQYMAGSMSLFASSNKREHVSFSHHVVAEERREQFKQGKGLETKWVVNNRNNHWLDAMYMACAGGGMLGIRLPLKKEGEPSLPQNREKPAGNIFGNATRIEPAGRPYFIGDRNDRATINRRR